MVLASSLRVGKKGLRARTGISQPRLE